MTTFKSVPGRGRSVGIAFTALSVAAVLTVGGCSDDGSKDASSSGSTVATTGSSKAQSTGLPSASAKQLLLPESDFPKLSGGAFTVTTDADEAASSSSEPRTETDNPECDEFFNADDSSVGPHAKRELEQKESSGNSLRTVSYSAKVVKGIDTSYAEDFAKILDSCGSVTIRIPNGDSVIPAKVRMSRITVPGVEGDYNAVAVEGTFEVSGTQFRLQTRQILGIERGASFQSGYSLLSTEGQAGDTGVDANLVSMFNEQRKILADAD